MKEDKLIEVTKSSVHTLQEGADFLRCSYGWLYAEVRAGKIDHFKLGNQYRLKGETLINLTEGKV